MGLFNFLKSLTGYGEEEPEIMRQPIVLDGEPLVDEFGEPVTPGGQPAARGLLPTPSVSPGVLKTGTAIGLGTGAAFVGHAAKDEIESAVVGEESPGLLRSAIKKVVGLGETVGESGIEGLAESQAERIAGRREAGTLTPYEDIRSEYLPKDKNDPGDSVKLDKVFRELRQTQPEAFKGLLKTSAERIGVDPDEIAEKHIQDALKLHSLADDRVAEQYKLVNAQSEERRQLEMKLKNPATMSKGEKISFGLAAVIPVIAAAISKRPQALQGLKGLGQAYDQRQGEIAQERQANQARFDRLTNDMFANNNVLRDALGKEAAARLSTAKGVFELDKLSRERIADMDKLAREGTGRSDINNIQIGSQRFGNMGRSFQGQILYRDPKAPKLGTEAMKRLDGMAQGSAQLERIYDITEQIVRQVGTQADGAIAQPVTYFDPILEKEVTVSSAAGALDTLQTEFKAAIKTREALGALGQDVLLFTDGLLDSSVGWQQFVKDVAGGQSQKVLTQINTLRDSGRANAQAFFEGANISTERQINRQMIEQGRLPGFQVLNETPQPGRDIKYTAPDGRVMLLTPEQVDKILRRIRSE